MKKLLLAMVCGLALVGCTTTHQTVVQQKSDPAWPDPIQPYQENSFKVIEQGGKIWVGMPFEDSQNFRIWLNDIQRYVKDQNSMICYYRSHLKESRCLPYLAKETANASGTTK